jgi:hypothetical protein
MESMNNINQTINDISANMSIEDEVLLKELINLIVTSERLDKSSMGKFKNMLLNNTDILGLFAQVMLAIILK